jgi:hypothetical protein
MGTMRYKLLALFVLLTATPTRAGDLPRQVPADAAELSLRLYEAGTSNNDPLLIVTAAHLRRQIAPLEVVDTSTWVSWREMLEKAEALAGEQTALQMLIQAMKSNIPRGGIDGPKVASVRVDGNKSYQLEQVFVADKPGYAYVETKAEVRVRLHVAIDGRTVCQQGPELGRALCRWPMKSQARVRITISNLSAAPTNMLMVLN